MRKIIGSVAALAVAGLLAVGVTAWTANASSTEDAPTLVLNKTVLRAGEVVHVSGDAGAESFNWVGSEAFTPRANDPYPGETGGSAEVTVDANGHYEGDATIAPVAPGDYTVSVRIGGGNAGSATITVVG
jgi:hypothetical protein